MMPANVVKSEADEKYWSRAKVYCKAKGYEGDRLWECVGGTFKRIKANAAKSKR